MVCRYANDKDMNDELRAVERADDPAAAFLTASPIRHRLDERSQVSPAETQSQGPTTAQIHRSTAAAEPIQHSTRIPMGRSR